MVIRHRPWKITIFFQSLFKHLPSFYGSLGKAETKHPFITSCSILIKSLTMHTVFLKNIELLQMSLPVLHLARHKPKKFIKRSCNEPKRSSMNINWLQGLRTKDSSVSMDAARLWAVKLQSLWMKLKEMDDKWEKKILTSWRLFWICNRVQSIPPLPLSS